MSRTSADQCLDNNEDLELKTMQETVYDIIKNIRDPEKPQTLEELNVVYEEGVTIRRINEQSYLVNVEFTPTIPHCSLASIIGLCLRAKIKKDFPENHKVDICIKKGSHTTGDEISKQINDKERIAAAMENPNLRELVNRCLEEEQ